MEQLPEYLKPNLKEKEHFYTQECMKLLRLDITIYILITSDLSRTFYNLSDFFLKNKINDDLIKQDLNKTIAQELKNFGWSVAHVFNKTGIIICNNYDELIKSRWSTSLDFTII